MGLSELPPEILLEIFQFLGKRDLNALVQTGRHFPHLFLVSLYHEDETTHRLGLTCLEWAAKFGRLDVPFAAP